MFAELGALARRYDFSADCESEMVELLRRAQGHSTRSVLATVAHLPAPVDLADTVLPDTFGVDGMRRDSGGAMRVHVIVPPATHRSLASLQPSRSRRAPSAAIV